METARTLLITDCLPSFPIEIHPVISERVREHPTQSPDTASIRQIPTQGVGMALKLD